MTRVRALAPRALSPFAWAAVVALALAAASPASTEPRVMPPQGTAPATEIAAPAAPAHGATDEPPADLHDLSAWLDYRIAHHISALPQEARLFYRRGLLARESGSLDEATRLVRGASELDPTFVAPHLTLASWSILSEPSQSLLQYATVLELARRNFTLQHALVSNALYLGLQALYLGLLAAAFLLVVLHARELHHPLEENLSRWLSPETGRWWGWGLLAAPFLVGLGPVLPTLVMLGWLWPHLRVRERLVFVTLLLAVVGSPLVTSSLDRLSTPLNEERRPFYGVSMVENEPYSPEREARLEALAREHDDNPYVHFGLAWTARRGGHLDLARREYQRALDLRPGDDRILNNLGNLLAAEGHTVEALALYEKAAGLNPKNAAATFNASQIYTQRFDYRRASEALSRASALDFDMVKSYQAQGTEDGTLALVDQWLAPATFWEAIWKERASGDAVRALPPSWRSRIELSGWPFAAVALALALIGLAAGVWHQRTVPLRRCSNCDAVVCRRCTQRRREVALCTKCSGVEARAESPEFARVLLLQHQRRARSGSHLVNTVFAALVPGYGLLSYQRVIGPVFLLSLAAGLAGGWIGLEPPFAYEPRLALSDPGLPVPVCAGLWILVYACSILGYFHRVNRARAQAAMIASPTRSRATQATRHIPPAAAA